MRDGHAWIWTAVLVQFIGYLYDAAWHGLLNPGVEPSTTREMARHLATVHLPLYLGAAGVLLTTVIAFVRRSKRSAPGIPLLVAVVGAVVSAGAEAWHAHDHLRLDTHTAPIAGVLSVVGFLVVVIAMMRSGRGRYRASSTLSRRRS